VQRLEFLRSFLMRMWFGFNRVIRNLRDTVGSATVFKIHSVFHYAVLELSTEFLSGRQPCGDS